MVSIQATRSITQPTSGDLWYRRKLQHGKRLAIKSILKSDNLQYNTLGRWVDGTIVWLTKCLMFQVLFLGKLFSKILSISFKFFYNFTKIKLKSFQCPKSKPVLFSIYQNNTWTIRPLVDKTIDPATQCIYIYWRLSDFFRFSYYRCNVLTTVDLRPSSNR